MILIRFLTRRKTTLNLILSPNNFGIFFLLFFFHAPLKEVIEFKNFNSEIALILIIILAIVLVIFINFKKNKFLILFISFYLFLSFFLNIYEISIKKINSFNAHFINNSSDIKKNIIKNITDQNNIYLVIIDEATSIEEFDKIYNTNSGSKFLEDIKNFNYTYIPGSYSSYNQTELTFASYFYLDYFITDKSNKYRDTKNLYPEMLKYNFEDLPLIKVLSQHNFKFYLIGNSRGDCDINKKTCLKNYEIKKKFFTEVSEIFFIKSAFYPIYNKIEERLRRFFSISLYDDNYYQNDAIQKFIDTTKGEIPKQSFFLLHAFYPHGPYIYNQDCSEKKINTQPSHAKNIQIADKNVGYFDNYLCALKKVKKIIQYLNKYDPEALVLIQSDHGKYFDLPKNKKQRLINFNLIKNLEKCKNEINENIDNVNSIRYALNCQLNLNYQILEKSSYWGPYSTKEDNWGKLEKINLDN